jgi:hypothetical protein
MFKRCIVATLALAFMAVQAFAAGSLSLSLSQQFDSLGRPLSGGKLYFFQTGTSTPQSAYQDTALTIAHPNPMTLDSSGRIAAFYLADGSIKIRLADAAGVTILAYDGLLVIGPSSGAGAAPSVDATTVLATGDVKPKYGTGTLTGFVRLNGRTIGSPTSGATERANADTQTLFEYLWTADANLAVSGGRGASANADWLANKTITLPDFRGRVPGGARRHGQQRGGPAHGDLFRRQRHRARQRRRRREQDARDGEFAGLHAVGNGQHHRPWPHAHTIEPEPGDLERGDGNQTAAGAIWVLNRSP